LLLERYYCLSDAEIYTPSYCEADVLTNPGEPDFDAAEACYEKISYYDYTVYSLCDYLYPEDNQYFGD